MNPKLIGFAGVLTFAMLGCGDTATNTGDTTIPTGPVSTDVEIDQISIPTCSGGNWVYEATTLGWTNGLNLVNAWETGNNDGWNDEHPLISSSFDDDYDYLRTDLSSDADTGSWVDGESTVFQCGIHDLDPVMTYAIRVYDLDNNYADCAIFATDPTGVATVFAGGAPTWVSVTAPGEISEADCLEWNVSR